jgi:magnesium-transporting ATPase (P-type)
MLNNLKLSKVNIKNFIPRGCIIHDTPYVVGIVIYVGRDTKINQNMRKVGFKESWLIQYINKTIYSLFIFLFVMIIIISTLSVVWVNGTGFYFWDSMYVNQYGDTNPKPNYDTGAGDIFSEWFKAFITTTISYSHLIPISLYVAIEIMKLILI